MYNNSNQDPSGIFLEAWWRSSEIHWEKLSWAELRKKFLNFWEGRFELSNFKRNYKMPEHKIVSQCWQNKQTEQ